jgi:hypothetical protein
MARKYKKEFAVTLIARTEDEEMTEKDMLRELREKADSVYDMKLEIKEVTQIYPEPPAATPPPAPATTEAPAPTAETPAPAPASETTPA